jgi:mannose-6-phosphate isomerase-like protein (cupin superfamily)
MTDERGTSYTIHEEPLFGLSEVMDVQKVIDDTTEPWVNWTLCRVNDSLVRLGVLHGEFHWHQHDEEDEFFLLLDGELHIELEDRTVELRPRQAFTVPKGVLHRPVVPVRSAVLMIENAGVVATGD